MDAIYVNTGIVGSDLLRRKVRVRGVAVGQKVRNRGGMPLQGVTREIYKRTTNLKKAWRKEEFSSVIREFAVNAGINIEVLNDSHRQIL